MATIGIIVFNEVEELDFAGPWEVFSASAMLQAESGAEPDRVLLVAESTDPVRCAKGLRVLPDVTLADVPVVDLVLVPGGMGTRREVGNPVLLDWLEQAANAATWMTSVCTGSFLLHAAGVANGRRLATHWASEDRLAELGVDVARDVRFVSDGPVVSSQGVSAGIDMALWLVGQLHSPEHARLTQRYIQYDPAPPYTAQT